jgi:RNA polymerase sigma factor for flagellar operon FliA
MLRLERQLGRTPEEDEMAQALSLSLEDYQSLLTEVSHLGCVSLHETLDHSEEGRSFLDNLEDMGGPLPSEIIEQEEMTQVLATILEELSEKERMVIALYYYEELTQKEIAEVLSVSEGRVSQLHSQALLKLRVKLINSELYEP